MIVIKDIEPNSLGHRAGFQPGDCIRSINGQEIRDLIDFQIQSAEELLWIEVERETEVYDVELDRSTGENFGLSFEDLKLRRCNNKCVFCFIHQMPEGMRSSLYFEDDDYRLSFLHGSYVTLTNIKEKDIERIIEQRLSPQYISVHATDPAVRQRMLGRRLPVDILERIERLAANQIEMHAQVVICPGWNDGEHLQRTVFDLRRFYPALRSVALVPVGLTRFRGNLPQLEKVGPDKAREYISLVRAWGGQFQRELGEGLVYGADELFLLNGEYPPESSYYDAFPQIENGIGMVRSFLDTWEKGKGLLEKRLPGGFHLGLVTGKLGQIFMDPIVADLKKIEGLEVDLVVVENHFFGPDITVTGLLCGKDIAKYLQNGSWDAVCLPPNCINGEGLTLDDMTVEQLQEEAGIPLSVGDYDLASTLQAIFSGSSNQLKGRGRQLSELGYFVGRTS